jgi:hypothetical protein
LQHCKIYQERIKDEFVNKAAKELCFSYDRNYCYKVLGMLDGIKFGINLKYIFRMTLKIVIKGITLKMCVFSYRVINLGFKVCLNLLEII